MAEFLVNSRGRCFLCWNPNPSQPQPPNRSEELATEGTCSTSIYSLQLLSRYLKLNMRKVFIGKVVKQELLDQVERSILKAELCEGCGHLTEKFSEIYLQQEKIEMEVTSRLELIYRKLLITTQSRKSGVNSSNGGLAGARQQVMNVIRTDMMRKCSRRLKSSRPRVKVWTMKKGDDGNRSSTSQWKSNSDMDTLPHDKKKISTEDEPVLPGIISSGTFADPQIEVSEITLAASNLNPVSKLPEIKIERDTNVDIITIDLEDDVEPIKEVPGHGICEVAAVRDLSPDLFTVQSEAQTNKENCYNQEPLVSNGNNPVDKTNKTVPKSDLSHVEVEDVGKKCMLEAQMGIENEGVEGPTSRGKPLPAVSIKATNNSDVVPMETESVETESTSEETKPSPVMSPKKNAKLWSRDNVTRRYSCDICSRQFAKLDQFWGHYDKDHAEIKYKCTLCEMEFLSQEECQGHRDTVHIPEASTASVPLPTPDECQVCNKPFGRDDLDLALETCRCESTLLPRKHICSCRYCRKGFTKVSGLKTHILNLHPQFYSKPKCPICKKNFYNNKRLKKHIQLGLCGGRKYICSCRYCRKGFQNVHQLKVHLVAVHFPTKEHDYHEDKCRTKFSWVGC